ncbi:PaaI family thioesterase [Sphingomonas sp. 1P06PA]
MRRYGHGAHVPLDHVAHGTDWVELALAWRADLVADAVTGILASGPIVTMMDMATSMAVWVRRGRFGHQATLDLRVDYLRPAVPGRTVIGRGECYRVTRRIAFVRGEAHDGDPTDPVAHVAGTFMLLGDD